MIPIARPMLGEEEAEAAKRVILSGWVTQGPKVKEFEDAFAGKVGAAHACAVSSCTTALHLALLAVGVQPGDVVVTVSHSFIATANAVRSCGAEPVFVDIEPDGYNMSVNALLSLLENDCVRKSDGLYYRFIDRIAVGESPLVHFNRSGKSETGRVAAILPVHQMGFPCDIFRIVEIAREWGAPVVEDAACAIGSEVSQDGGEHWEMIGKPHGDAACFSFHPRKVLTTGDGGMITTDNASLDARVRLLRQHGMSVSDVARHKADRVIFEDYATTAYNYRMTDIQAAIGVEQLKKLDGIVHERRTLAALYSKALSDAPNLLAPEGHGSTKPNYQSYPVTITRRASINQLELMGSLLEQGVSTRRGIMNAHQEPVYSDASWVLPESEMRRDQTILIPLYNGMEKRDLEKTVDGIRMISSRGSIPE